MAAQIDMTAELIPGKLPLWNWAPPAMFHTRSLGFTGKKRLDLQTF